MAENNKATSSPHTARISNASVRSRALGRIPDTLNALNSPSTDERRLALAEAVRSFSGGHVVRPHDTGWVNTLARTFFSYSYDGYSPSRLAWEAVIRGLSVIGCADLDNLGALGEMQTAGDALGIRVTVSLETVARAQSHGDREVNCPGSPGLVRALGVGFTDIPAVDCDHGQLIASLPDRLRRRNRAMIDALNPLLAPVTVDHDEDVLPLTPAGNATPEHVALAYVNKAKEVFADAPDQAVFWADVLACSPKDAEALIQDEHALIDAVGDKLRRMAPEQPDPGAHPAVEDFFRAVLASGALPCLLWADGQSAGEEDADRLLDEAVGWGVRAVAVAPDACWNVADPEAKKTRLAALAAMMAAAKTRSLPVLAGSFMNGARQKFVDSFDAPELSAFFRDFTDGAFWLYGHATLQRASGLGLGGEWSQRHFGRDHAAANAFYTETGKKAAPGKTTRARIAGLGPDPQPGDILDALAPLRI